MRLFKKYIEKRIEKGKEDLINEFHDNPTRFMYTYYRSCPMKFLETYEGVEFSLAQKLWYWLICKIYGLFGV